MRLPLIIVFAIVALNITMFTLMLQMDFLVFHSPIAKAVAWIFTIGAWALAYVNRKKSVKLF